MRQTHYGNCHMWTTPAVKGSFSILAIFDQVRLYVRPVSVARIAALVLMKAAKRVSIRSRARSAGHWAGSPAPRLGRFVITPSVPSPTHGPGCSRSQLHQWRRSFRVEQKDAAEQQIGFVPAVAPEPEAAEPALAGSAGGGAIEIEFAGGTRMRITGRLTRRR